jgi:hypothetical protein
MIDILLLGCGKLSSPPPRAISGAITAPIAVEWHPVPTGSAKKVTHAKIEELGLDMTERQVTDLLGPADATVAGDETKTLRWGEGDRLLELTFSKEGRLRDLSAAGLEQTPANLTRANVDRIASGAYRREVIHLLGPYKQIKIAKPGEMILNWEDGDKLISLTFNNDRVVNKLVRGLE